MSRAAANGESEAGSRVFGPAYAAAYDLLYEDKDYAAEADYVLNRLTAVSTRPIRSVLDLGAGTGRHAAALAARGLSIHGVDRSAEMLAKARTRCRSLDVHFTQADVRSLDLHRRFDAVVALFHVASYQITDADLAAFFSCIGRHLAPGGAALLDCWFGPAVEAQKPARRRRRITTPDGELIRTAHGVLNAESHTVDVHLHTRVRDREGDVSTESREMHRMRYLFKDEIRALACAAGLRLARAEEWLSGRGLGPDTWSGCFVLTEAAQPGAGTA